MSAFDSDASSDRLNPIRLSKRELEVLQLISEGRSSQEAADRLYLSKKTINFHLDNIYRKLQVNNRMQAYRRALELGVI